MLFNRFDFFLGEMHRHSLHFFLVKNVVEESKPDAMIQMDMCQEDVQRIGLNKVARSEDSGAGIEDDP